MRISTLRALMMTAVLAAASNSLAATELDCQGNDENYVCLSLPDDAPEGSLTTYSEAAPTTLVADMVSAEELTGEMADFSSLPIEPEKKAFELEPNRGLVAAMKAQEKLKQVENYLRAGPANGDGIVSTSDRKKRDKN